MTTIEPQTSEATQRTRRNMMKMGAIAVPATLATLAAVRSAAATTICGPLGYICITLPGKGGKSGGGGGNCFLKGTKIRTAEGERAIEDLAIGDLLPTMFGGLRPVQWIGRHPIRKSDPTKAWVKDALPIRIARSALGPELPHADLCVTGGHSLLIDGVLVPAELLVNGTTITRYEPESDAMELFHIKLESHDVIYAEGAPVETLLAVQDSWVNFAEYFRQYGMVAADETRCAPHIHIWGGRPELVSRLRSALSPWIDLRNQAEVLRDQLEEARLQPDLNLAVRIGTSSAGFQVPLSGGPFALRGGGQWATRGRALARGDAASLPRPPGEQPSHLLSAPGPVDSKPELPLAFCQTKLASHDRFFLRHRGA